MANDVRVVGSQLPDNVLYASSHITTVRPLAFALRKHRYKGTPVNKITLVIGPYDFRHFFLRRHEVVLPLRITKVLLGASRRVHLAYRSGTPGRWQIEKTFARNHEEHRASQEVLDQYRTARSVYKYFFVVLGGLVT